MRTLFFVLRFYSATPFVPSNQTPPPKPARLVPAIQKQFPTCKDRDPQFLGTASYIATCPNGGEYFGGFDWRKVGADIRHTISGLVLLSKTPSEWVFLAAHDVSSSGERLSRISIRSNGLQTVIPVSWESPPSDVEALFSFDGFIFAATSTGNLYQLSLSEDQLSVTQLIGVNFSAMIASGNCEAAFIHEIDGRKMFIVASRGSVGAPSTIAWREITTSPITFPGTVGTATYTTPFPASNVRHVSDLRTDHAGNLFVSSSSDPGDNGPFSSAVYHIGAFLVLDAGIPLGSGVGLAQLQPPREIYRSHTHKIEAICLTPNDSLGMILGSDDENFGGSIFAQGQRVLGIPVGEPVKVTRQAWSKVSVEDAERIAREAARKEAVAVMACLYVARDCATPECTYYFGSFGYDAKYPPVCCYGTGETPVLAADEARRLAVEWASRYCPQ